jgi:hypothetical protein|nr:hypothetical protein [Luteimonas mephitis]
MRLRLVQLSIVLVLALGAAPGAFAQSKAGSTSTSANTAVLPVIYSDSGNGNKVGAYLLLEPTDNPQTGARWRFGGKNELDAAFGLDAGDSLALLCSGKSGIGSALSSLVNNCKLGSISDDGDDGSHHASATAALSRPGGSVGITAGKGKARLPAWLTPNAGRAGDININDLTVFAQKNIGREGTVSIAGTMAKAQLIPSGDIPAGLADNWDSKTLSIGGAYGAFGASIIGQVVSTPGQQQWEGLGIGLTWRTPWSGQLTIGADNLVTRGKNPFSPSSDAKQDEGAIPYVRYEQDL